MNHSLRKLTVKKIHNIFTLRSEGWKQQAIADDLGVSLSMVSLVLAGKRHAQHTGIDPRDYKSPASTPEQIKMIIDLAEQGASRKEIAYLCNRSYQTVGDVLKGKVHRGISGINKS